VQAEAAGIAPTVDMNPVLLKPTTDMGSQVIVMGKAVRTIAADEYYKYTPTLLETIESSLNRLRAEYDIVVIEGAGSPAEINLKEREIVNMRVAKMSGAPVLLVGDIDRGGVFASIVGTLELLDAAERDLIRGLVINKFRGDLSLLKSGLDFLEQRTGRPVLGVIPYFHDIRIAQEDSVYLDQRAENGGGDLDIAVIRLPRISNYDDFDPLEEAGCLVRYISQRSELGNPHLIIIPGTKSTVTDLRHLRQTGLADILLLKSKEGVPIVGICGGYQMLGQKILDPGSVESAEAEADGLGLLDVTTTFAPEKSTRQVRARTLAGPGLLAGTDGLELSGYEIHMGETVSAGASGAFQVFATPQGETDYGDGAVNAAGTVLGTYMHGLFENDDFRQSFLNNLRGHWGLTESAENVKLEKDSQYDKLAELVRASLDMELLYKITEGKA
jgi:adenosylcobyric acid synthase